MTRATIRTEFIYPPIPVRCCDWQATLANGDERSPVGHGETEEAAIADLLLEMECEA